MPIDRDDHASLASPPQHATDELGAEAVEANARITGSMGALLFVVFAVEGLTILFGVRAHLSLHVFIGLLAVPPIAVKLASTGHRIVRYYVGDARYVRKGPPPLVLRLVGPLVALTSVAVIATGIADLLLGPSQNLTRLHKLSFIAWFGVMAIHVLGHLLETPALAAADWSTRSARLRGTATRRSLVVATLALGIVLGWWSLSWIPSAFGAFEQARP